MEYKHYIRLIEGTNIICHGFSDWKESATPEDIEVATTNKRHFEINGITNPKLVDELNLPNYIFTNGKIEKTDGIWKEKWKNTPENLANTIRDLRIVEFQLIDKYQLVLIHDELSSEEKSELFNYRRDWLDAPSTLLVPERPNWLI